LIEAEPFAVILITHGTRGLTQKFVLGGKVLGEGAASPLPAISFAPAGGLGSAVNSSSGVPAGASTTNVSRVLLTMCNGEVGNFIMVKN